MKITDKYSFGDILLVDYAFSDGKGSKLRPTLFLFSEKEDCTILKMTSQDSNGDAFSLAIQPDDQNALKVTTHIKTKKITTFHESLFYKKIGSISSLQKKQVKASLENIFHSL